MGNVTRINDYLDYRNFNSDELESVLKFMGGKYYTGTAIINKIVNLFTGTIPRLCYKIYRFLVYKYLQ